MTLWSLDDWKFLERRTITAPNGREWNVALMDILGQEGDPDMPSLTMELQYASGRYFTLVYPPGGSLQWERGYTSLAEATTAYERLAAAIADGRIDPSQPVFKEGLDD
jgi:hypothetical protein